jgi:hypothetical protein
MDSKLFSFVLSGVFAFAWIAGAADTGALTAVRQSSTGSLDAVVDQSHGHLKWSHGMFLYMDSGVNARPPSFYTLDREGKLITSATLSIPDAAQFWFADFDRWTDGAIVFAGGSYSSYGEAAPFIAWLSSDGQTERVMRTAPYYVYRLSAAPDGTVWTLGYEMINHNTKDPSLNPDAGVLRHFDRTGRLIGSALPQSTFSTNRKLDYVSSGHLVATRDRLGWYTPRTGKAKYIEISTGTMEVHVYPGLPPNLSAEQNTAGLPLIDGFTLTEAGDASLSVVDGSAGARTAYSFDRGKSEWVRLQVPAVDGYYPFRPHLMGSDGDQLVFQYGSWAGFFSVSH